LNRSAGVARNITTTLITQVVTWGLSFAVLLFLPTYAGAAGYGNINLAVSFASILGIFSGLGVTMVIMRDIPREPRKAGTLVLASLILRLPLALLSIGLGLMIGKALGYSDRVLLYIGIYLTIAVIGVFADTFNAAVRGLQTFSFANMGQIIDKVVSSVIIIAVCLLKGPLWMVVAAYGISVLFSLTVMVKGLTRPDVDWVMPTKDQMMALARSGIPFVSAGVFTAIYGKSDALFLARLSDNVNIGWYSLAFRIAGTAMALPTTVCSAMLPPLSALYKENLALFIDGTARLLNIMVICCVPVAAVMVFCSAPLVSLFSHGAASFKPASLSVQIYGVAIILFFLSQGASSAVIACDREKIFSRAMAVAAFFSIPITALCIYIGQKALHNGSAGACISDLIPEVYLLGCYLAALPKGSVSFSLLATGLKACLAALPLMAMFYLVPSRFALFSAIPCVAIYGFMCLKLGCLHVRDIDVLKSMAKDKIGLK
jgi:O-antigen/teichoic acid export membrane protein